MHFSALAAALLATTSSVSGAILKRGGGGPPPPPLCGRFDWLDIYYGDITSSGIAELGFKVPSGLQVGEEYTIQLLNIPSCTPQSTLGAIPEKDFTLQVILESWDGTSSTTISPESAHATDLVFPFAVPNNATSIRGEVAIRFKTSKKPSAVNDLFNTYGPVLVAA